MGINWDAVQYGTVGDWVSGIGALGAVIVAVWISTRENRLRREQHAGKVRVGVQRNSDYEGTKVVIFNGANEPIRSLNLPSVPFVGGGALIVEGKNSLKPGKQWAPIIPKDSDWTGYIFFGDVSGEQWAIDSETDKLLHLSRSKYFKLMFGQSLCSQIALRVRRQLGR